MKQFIGAEKIFETEVADQKTAAGAEIVKVKFENGKVEHFSKSMFDAIVSDKSCDASELREKRVKPVVQMLLAVLEEWGVKVGELPYISTLLNTSLEYNKDQAYIKLLERYMPKPNSLDDVDLVTIDRILKDAGTEEKAK